MRRSLVFIHGRHSRPVDWVAAVQTGLQAAGRDPLPQDLDLVEVDYADVLHDVLASMPERELPIGERSDGFSDRQDMVRLSMHRFTVRPRSVYDFTPKEWVTRRIISRMPEIQRYQAFPTVRAAVRDSCLQQLPDGELLIIGHSLGAVVAFDLVHYLPPETHVNLLFTIGSPMARRQWRDALAEYGGKFPTADVGTWVNLVNKGDWVTAGDGIHLWYSQAIDAYASLGLGNHAEMHYLSSAPAGVAIGDALARSALGSGQ